MSVNFVEAAALDVLKTGKMMRINIQDQDILLANVDDTIYAVDNTCTHEDASLYNGALKGRCVECPLHGSLFDLANGEPQTEPATEAIRTYPVKIQNNMILIGLE